MRFNSKSDRTQENDTATAATHLKSMGLTIHGTDRDETISGDWYSGEDRFYGGGGDDTIYGFADNDILYGGAGEDLIYGGDGDDRIRDWSGGAQAFGGAGNDHISVGGSDPDSDSVAFGGAGDDKMGGGFGDDFIYGGEGNDLINGNEGNDYLAGGDGDDHIHGGAGSNTIVSGSGNDIMYGGGGTGSNDTFILGSGTNNVFGGSGDDTIVITEMSSGHIAAGEHDIDGFPEWDGSDYNVLDLSEMGECDISEIVDNGDGTGYVVFASGEVVTFEFIDEIIPPTPHDGDNGFNDSTHDDTDCIDTDLDGAKVDGTGQIGLDLWQALTVGQAALSEQMPVVREEDEDDRESEIWF